MIHKYMAASATPRGQRLKKRFAVEVLAIQRMVIKFLHLEGMQ